MSIQELQSLYGTLPQASALVEFFKQKTIKGRQIEVKHIEQVSQIGTCHVVFIAKNSTIPVKTILDFTKSKPILTIGESNEASKSGILINFIEENGELSYEINPKSYNQAQLQIDYFFLKTSKVMNQN